MGNELGGAYIGQMIAKDAMHKALYGKAKKLSLIHISEPTRR